MKPIARFALAGLGVAALGAIAWGLYVRKSDDAVRRVTKPVEFSAPDLFPAQTLLYAEMRGWDQSFARAEAWWKKFEGTAAWLALRRGWKKDKLGLPPGAVETIERVDRELDRAKEKFVHRPTTREFFESYGKHVAVGILPAPKGERPRFLLATRLPDAAPAALQGSLSKAGGVTPSEPPLHKGFPVYQERVSDATVHYGVGRGYLFVSDSLPEIRAALERLALATDEKKKAEGTLALDPVLARVRAAESGVVYLRRDVKLAEWKPELAPVDDFIRSAFVVAPKDEAVAFSLSDGRCSFHDAAPKPWTKSLPPGLIWLDASVPVPAGRADVARFLDKPLWKELDAFLSDPKRVKEFLAEAIPADRRPDDEIASRLPNDVRLLGAWLKEWFLEAANVEAPSVAFASKIPKGIDSEPAAQAALGVDLDPFSVFLIAGGLEHVRSRWPDWVDREEKPGVQMWSLNIKRATEEVEKAPPEIKPWLELVVMPYWPSLIVSGNRVLLVFGIDFAQELAALQSGGGPSFEDDPLFVEARGQVRPGYVHLSWDRPGDRIRNSYETIESVVYKVLEMAKPDEETEEVIFAGLKTVRRLTEWAKPSRAVLSGTYLDPARPFESVELVDPVAEKGVPSFAPADAPARSLDLLPADAWIYGMRRVELKPSYDALRAVFVEALPGGEERLKELMKPGTEAREALDLLVDGLVRNVRGEVGFAIVTPRPKSTPGEGPTPGALMARLPAVVAFAEFEKPLDGFRAVRKGLELLHQALTPRPVENPGEFYSEFKVGMIGEYRAAALDLFLPMGEERAVVSLCAVERSGFVFLTTSGEVLRRFGSAKEGDADSLSARLPANPGKVSSLGLFHGDTLLRQVRLYAELASRAGVMLTLGGYEEGPPADRLQAHLDGWAKWTDLVLDLFSTKSWTVSSAWRAGNVVRTTTVVAPEK